MKILNQLRSYKILKDVFKTEKILCVLTQVLTRSYMSLTRTRLFINIYKNFRQEKLIMETEPQT